jgi:hypothetical protein
MSIPKKAHYSPNASKDSLIYYTPDMLFLTTAENYTYNKAHINRGRFYNENCYSLREPA